MNENWHSTEADSTLKLLASTRNGLSAAEASERLNRYGENKIIEKKRVSPIVVFFRQFLSPLIFVLIGAVIIEVIIGGYLNAGVILAVLIIMATIGFIQETNAEKTMEALMQLAAPKAKIRRDGRVSLFLSQAIVPGDIIQLEVGDKVAADARLIEVSNLKINEASLTGESMPVDKHTRVLGEDTSIADRKNMVFTGTVVTNGRAVATVTSTGMNTELGKIASVIGKSKTKQTPLQRSVSKMSRYILFLILGACIILVILGILEGLPALDVVLLTVAAAVSAIPEGLPATVIVTLAIGMRMMARHNAIVRRLVAIETLGAATVICSDKTGTLTLNQMVVKNIFVDESWIDVTGDGYQPEGRFLKDATEVDLQQAKSLLMLLQISALCNDALLTKELTCCDVIGDPTEGALVVAAAKAGIDKEKLELAYPRLDEIPFQSNKQFMATLHEKEGKKVIYIKGSPEKLLSLSNRFLSKDEISILTLEKKVVFLENNDAMAKKAMRVIAAAYIEFEGKMELCEEDIKDSVFVGLVGMIDPPREDAKNAVMQCTKAGIKVVMVTGDNKITAASIAGEISLPPGRAITGFELQQISDTQLSKEIMDYSIFARIEPLHKLRIVNAFKSQGHIVAMTGDGVNDAPALKSADIGVAMGISGTDVAKEASDMILADDNFASLVTAVEEGRTIFNRLRNVTFFLLTTAFGELLGLMLCVSLLSKAPLLPLQIIWINLVTGVILAIPLGLEPKTGQELKQSPRHPKVGLVFPGLLFRIGSLALMLGLGIFLVFQFASVRYSLEEARTIVFCTVVIFEWLIALNARSDENTVFRMGILRNRWLAGAVMAAIFLQLIVIYAVPLKIAFTTVALGAGEWGIALIPGVSIFVLESVRKIVFPGLFSTGKWQPVKGNR